MKITMLLALTIMSISSLVTAPMASARQLAEISASEGAGDAYIYEGTYMGTDGRYYDVFHDASGHGFASPA